MGGGYSWQPRLYHNLFFFVRFRRILPYIVYAFRYLSRRNLERLGKFLCAYGKNAQKLLYFSPEAAGKGTENVLRGRGKYGILTKT